MRQHAPPLKSLARLDDVRDLVAAPGPFLSVHLSFRPPSHDLAERIALGWRSSRDAAAAAGAPLSVLEAVDEIIEAGPQRQGAGLSVVVTPEGRRLVDHLTVAPDVELVGWEPAPALTPLLAARQTAVPHIVVLVDRAGGDLLVRTADATRGGEEMAVEGAESPLRKVAAGGWSQRRIQQRAEDTWRRNMADLARQVAVLARRVDPGLIAVGGDERAVNLLRESLPSALRELTRPVDVTRAADGSADDLDVHVERVLRAHLDEELAHTLGVYRRELGQHDRATAGPVDTFAALGAGRVAVLLATLGTNDTRRAWIAPDRQQVAMTPDALPDSADAQSAPLVDASIAVALATNADVRIVAEQDAPSGGIGALLRW